MLKIILSPIYLQFLLQLKSHQIKAFLNVHRYVCFACKTIFSFQLCSRLYERNYVSESCFSSLSLSIQVSIVKVRLSSNTVQFLFEIWCFSQDLRGIYRTLLPPPHWNLKAVFALLPSLLQAKNRRKATEVTTSEWQEKLLSSLQSCHLLHVKTLLVRTQGKNRVFFLIPHRVSIIFQIEPSPL